MRTALLLVVVVVLKQAVFPPLTTTDRCGHTVTQLQHTTPTAWNDPLRYVLLILPIVNGLLMSFNTKFNPLKKHTLCKSRYFLDLQMSSKHFDVICVLSVSLTQQYHHFRPLGQHEVRERDVQVPCARLAVQQDAVHR